MGAARTNEDCVTTGPMDEGLGKRLAVGVAIMSFLIVAVALSGRLGLRHVVDTTQDILVRDTHVSEEALNARVATLLLRRYEKDYFLNVGAPDKQADYLEKWKAAREGLRTRLDALDQLVPSEEDHATLRAMRADLTTYLAGFEKVAGDVRSGALATPQAANGAIAQYKDAIHHMEETSEAIAGASDIKMDKRLALLKQDTAQTNNQMTLIALLAVAVAALIGMRARGVMKAATAL